MNLLVTDIDGTLAADGWRSHVADYDERQRLASDDSAVPPMLLMLAALAKAKWHLCGLTSRNERWRQATHHWLRANAILLDELHMRADDDFSSAVELKLVAVKQLLITHKPAAMLLVDSRAEIVHAYKAEGWTALCTQS